jgi:hypothetical protein
VELWRLFFPGAKPMNQANFLALLDTIDGYFETMFDSDLARFDRVFAPTAQLHGLRDGQIRILTVAEYRALLASTPSPKTKDATRQQEILLVDFASADQAMVKLRVRIDTNLYLDYLALHMINGAWRVTAKSFHVERRFDAQTAQ